MASRLKQKLTALSQESTAYGVPKLVYKNKSYFLRFYWLFFIAVGSSLSAWYIYDTVTGYLSYQVVTRIESIYEQPMRFPTVSFCPHKTNFFENTSFNSIFTKCNFRLETLMPELEKHFEEFYTQDYGKCFRFNSGKNMAGKSIPILNSTVGGRDDSLYMWLNQNTGLVIWIHEPNLPPNIERFHNLNNGLYASSGFGTQFILHKIEEKRLGIPYHNCYEDVSTFPLNKTLIKFIQSKNETYSQVNCFKLCFEIDYISNNYCNCQNTSLGNVWQDCFVKLEKQDLSGCTHMKKIKFYRSSVIDKCQEYCPLECSTVSYAITYNLMNYLPSTTPTVIVYFDNLRYTSITQEPKMKDFDLISNIGGIFSLFIGLGFVTFFEIGELVIESLFVLIKEEKTKKITQYVLSINKRKNKWRHSI